MPATQKFRARIHKKDRLGYDNHELTDEFGEFFTEAELEHRHQHQQHQHQHHQKSGWKHHGRLRSKHNKIL